MGGSESDAYGLPPILFTPLNSIHRPLIKMVNARPASTQSRDVFASII
jgi:hypothetical protein